MLSNQPIPKRGRKFHFRTAVRAVVMNQPIPTRGRKPLKTNLSDGELWEPTHPQAGTKICLGRVIEPFLQRNQPIPTRGRKFIANNCIILYTRTNPSPLGDENGVPCLCRLVRLEPPHPHSGTKIKITVYHFKVL